MSTHFEVLRDRSDSAAQRIADLAKNTSSPGKSLIVEDEEPLINAIRAGLEIQTLYVVEGVELSDALHQACVDSDVPIMGMDTQLTKDLFRTDKIPRVFGVGKTPRPVRLKDLAALNGDVLILDGVRIVGNIGAICRSAVAFGASGLVLVDSGLKSIADRRLIRASRGYVFSLPVALANWEGVEHFIETTAIQTISLDIDGSDPLTSLDTIDSRVAFVLGSEITGLSEQAKRLCPQRVGIEMSPAVESLNVSVSAGIILQRRSGRNLAWV